MMKDIINDLKEIRNIYIGLRVRKEDKTTKEALRDRYIDGLCAGIDLAVECIENDESLKMFKVVFKNGLDMIVECKEVVIIRDVAGISSVMFQGANAEVNAQEILYIQEI